MFHSASHKEIKAGKITDAYFPRTLAVLKAKKINKWVKAEFIAKGLPGNLPWGILAGIEECVELLGGLKVSVRSMGEGTVFKPYQPVMEIEGKYSEFGKYETALLGFLCQASGVATKAARCKKAAGDRPVISFGGRRVHPAIAPVVERSSFIGGFEGVAILKSAEIIGEEAMGTMPHSLIIIMGDTVEATRAYSEVIGRKVKTISLIDTFNDEKFEALRVAEALSDKLYAVRVDTPASRRGNFLRILEEMRWELDLRGYNRVKLFVSGGLDESDIVELNPLVNGYGLGTSVSNARVIYFSMDIVEVDGKPVAKKGKMSGSKRVFRCSRCMETRVLPENRDAPQCACNEAMEEILLPLFQNGDQKQEWVSAEQIRQFVIDQIAPLGLDNPATNG
ncbi:MAG: nicotinate phosphoribosyltransferase [Deltaproteobacteria bacterium]|nr:nicotinate phosphoribosyltransferase [Deltaproteobacteria bacterium]